MSTNKSNPAKTAAIVTLASVVGLFAGKKILNAIEKKRAENAGNQVDNKDPKIALATVLAQRAFAAFHPSGYPGLWDGTNEAELYKIGKEMFANKIPFATLTSLYKKIYNRSFVDDLNNELSSTELTKFYSNLQKGFGNVSKAINHQINYL
jgi:hypothetical protein